MTNKYYAAGEKRAEKVNDLFDTIARRYDLINDLSSFGLHRHWKRRLVQLSSAGFGTRALDLCCGTGDIALALARTGAEVVGLDFSEPMLAVARKRVAARNGGAQVRFLKGDALHVPFPDDSFDVVTISYGLRNLASLEDGLREMRRVARPGGRLLVLDFGKPDNALWRGVYFSYLRRCCPPLGRIFCGDPETHAYILESLLHYPGQRGVATEMEKLQLGRVRIVNFMGGITGINLGEKPR